MTSLTSPSKMESQFKCAVCGDTFRSKVGLGRHGKTKCTMTSPRTDVTPATSDGRGQRRQTARDTSKPPWECEICGATFSRRYVLSCHYRTHSGKKPYECAACGEKFTWSVQLRLHAAKHPGEFIFKCFTCDERFKTSVDLQKHSLIHPKTGVASVLPRPTVMPGKMGKKRPYRRSKAASNNYCVICRKSFHKLHYLQNHWRAVHQGENMFECGSCGATFRWAMQLRVHAIHHPNEAVFKCPQCEAKFKTQKDMTKHKRSHPNYRYQCTVCYEKFALLKEILSHSRRHTRAKCYKCSDCDRCFAQPHLLKRHSAGHDPMRSGEGTYDEPGQRYHCGVCRVCFSRSELLAAHIKQHLNPRPHQCEWCGKCFLRADNLRCHIRIHTGETPYHCEFCSKGFKESGQLVKHRRIHTGEKPYICESCGKAFTDSSKVKKHIRSMHSGPNGTKKPKQPRSNTSFKSTPSSVASPSKTTPPLPTYSSPVQPIAAPTRPPITQSITTPLQTIATPTQPITAPIQHIVAPTHSGAVNVLGHPIPYECGLCFQQFLDSAAIIAHMETHTGRSTSCIFLPNGESRRSLTTPNTEFITTSAAEVPQFDADSVREFFQRQEQILASKADSPVHDETETTVSQPIFDEQLTSFLAPLAPAVSPQKLVEGVVAPVLDDDSVIDRASVMPTSELTRSKSGGICTVEPTGDNDKVIDDIPRVAPSNQNSDKPSSTAVPKIPGPVKRKAFYDLYTSFDSTSTDDSNMACAHCGRKFKTRLILLQHQNTHTGEKPFGCTFCSQDFSNYVKLVNHALTHEEYDKKCFICQKSFDVPAKLMKHTRYHLSQSRSKCKTCGEIFSQSISLEEHMRSAHSSSEPHQCEHCGKLFKLKANLDSHRRIHTGEKPFGPCEYCGKFFRELGQFKKHIRTHNGERPYQCPYCPKAFLDSTKRKRHCKNLHKDMVE